MCANADPGRDLVRRDHRVGIDATRKLPGDERNGDPVRPFPPLITMCDEIRQSVEARASVFGLA